MGRMGIGLLSVVALLVALPAGAQVSGESPAGRWVGGFELGERWHFLRVHLEDDRGRLRGDGSIPAMEISARPLATAAVTGSALALELGTARGRLRFAGELTDGVWIGTVRSPEREGTFRLERSTPVSAEEFDPLIGTYEGPSGRVLLLARWNRPSYLFVFDGETRLRIHPLGEDRFLSEAGDELVVSRRQDGAGAALLWRPLGAGRVRCDRTELYDSIDVDFAGDGVRLTGTLYLPRGAGRHSAVVLVHGSGAATRQPYRPVAHLFARAGIAALFFDKRGTGDSEGDWSRVGLGTLAMDVLGAVGFLRDHPRIDPDQVGLWGISQAGWVTTLAASRSDEIAWLVPFSGAAVSPAEQELYRISRNVRDATGSERLVDTAVKMSRLTYEALLMGQSSDARAERFHLPGIDMQYDPVPDLARIRQPILAVFGELDSLVPTGISARRYEELPRSSGNLAARAVIFPSADHGLYSTRTGSRFEVRVDRRYAPGVWETVLDWVRATTRGEPPPLPAGPVLLTDEVPVETMLPGLPGRFGGLWVQTGLLLLFALAFPPVIVGWLLRRIWRLVRRQPRRTGSLERRAVWLASILAVSVLGAFAVVVARLWSIAGATWVEIGFLPYLLPLLGLLATAACALVFWAAFQVWRKKCWSRAARWQLALVTLASALLIPFLAFWNLLPG